MLIESIIVFANIVTACQETSFRKIRPHLSAQSWNWWTEECLEDVFHIIHGFVENALVFLICKTGISNCRTCGVHFYFL